MAGRRGRKLEAAAADGLVETSPVAIYLWLVRTVRMASPDPAIHTQFRFGELLGRDGTFVSHVESGRRNMPTELRERWLTLIGLDVGALTDYLVAATPSRPFVAVGELGATDEATAFTLVDEALDGAALTPREWTIACGVAGSIRLPRTVQRFSRLATDAMAATSTPDYQIMRGALHRLPDDLLVTAARDAVAAAPSRGNHAADLLGGVDAAYGGPILRSYFRSMPDPWMDRGVVASMRRLIARGDLAAVADDPATLQESLVEAIPGAASWMTRVELANLIRVLGPVPEPLRRRLADDPDLDVRLAAGGRPDEAAAAAVRELREYAVDATLDHMYGSAVSDPLADKLVGLIILGRTEPDRVRAAQTVALSPYRDRCVEVLTRTAHSSTTSPEVRRSACLALANLGPSREASDVLTRLALSDPNPSVRARATWSLIPHRQFLQLRLCGGILRDHDEVVRAAAVDLAAAMNNTQILRTAAADHSARIAEQSTYYLARASE